MAYFLFIIYGLLHESSKNIEIDKSVLKEKKMNREQSLMIAAEIFCHSFRILE